MRHPDTSWNELQKRIAEAKALADFANLAPSDIRAFRKDNPDFFPVAWWDYKPIPPSEVDVLAMKWPETQWQIVQRLIRGAWKKRFQISASGFVTLLGCVFDPETMGWSGNRERLPAAMGWDMTNVKDSPYHEVVRWLVGQSWRVKQCEQCGKCFIAEASKRKFCSTEGDASCFSAHRKADRKNSASEVNEDRRNNYDPEKRRRLYLRDKRRKA